MKRVDFRKLSKDEAFYGMWTCCCWHYPDSVAAGGGLCRTEIGHIGAKKIRFRVTLVFGCSKLFYFNGKAAKDSLNQTIGALTYAQISNNLLQSETISRLSAPKYSLCHSKFYFTNLLPCMCCLWTSGGFAIADKTQDWKPHWPD